MSKPMVQLFVTNFHFVKPGLIKHVLLVWMGHIKRRQTFAWYLNSYLCHFVLSVQCIWYVSLTHKNCFSSSFTRVNPEPLMFLAKLFSVPSCWQWGIRNTLLFCEFFLSAAVLLSALWLQKSKKSTQKLAKRMPLKNKSPASSTIKSSFSFAINNYIQK